MNPSTHPSSAALRGTWKWSLLPLVILVAAAVLANTGTSITKDANAAAGSVVVSATVAPVASVTANGCSSAISFAINAGALGAGGQCAVTFGSSNTTGITLTADDSTQTDQFFIAGTNHFADHAGACGPLTADEVGYKVAATTGSVTVNLCGGLTSAMATNTNFSAIPNDVPAIVGADTVCTTTAIGTTHGCTIAVNTFETGSNHPNVSYTGTISLTTS